MCSCCIGPELDSGSWGRASRYLEILQISQVFPEGLSKFLRKGGQLGRAALRQLC